MTNRTGRSAVMQSRGKLKVYLHAYPTAEDFERLDAALEGVAGIEMGRCTKGFDACVREFVYGGADFRLCFDDTLGNLVDTENLAAGDLLERLASQIDGA